MSSYSTAVRPRRTPQQERGQRRVESLLDAAESVIAAHGYEAATMSEIADKAGASIGSLYQFFPSKRAVVQSLRRRYRDEFANEWLPIECDMERMNLEQFAARLIDMTIAFIERHPAFAALLDAPRSTRIPGAMEERVADFVQLKRRMPQKSAQHLASVVVHIVRAFSRAWVETGAHARPALKREFRSVLVCYMSSRLGRADHA